MRGGNDSQPGWLLVGVALATALAAAQLSAAQSTSAEHASRPAPRHSFQRSAEIYDYATLATSGPQRGLELYYYKCWTCHNDYAIAAGTPAITLEALYKRPQLLSEQPVNDATIADKIRNGGPGMPAFRYDLSDADIADLLSYIRTESCCYMGEEPPANPRYRATPSPTPHAQVQHKLRGGLSGVVRSAAGDVLEGIMVQLIAKTNGIRTTVYSDADGRYDFPRLPVGQYTLRIARPLEFQPYQKDSLQIDDATQFEEIVLRAVAGIEGFEYSELLPPTRQIAAQLTGAEWLMNLSGTGQEKRVFSNACGFACHSYQQIFRNRYDEHGWRLLIERTTRHTGAPLIIPAGNRRMFTGGNEEEDLLISWLARIRGPDSKDSPFKVLPGPRGAATRVVVTEYEMPRLLVALHDVDGDSQGNVWYTAHRSPYIGKLDPRSGVVTEYRVPSTPGGLSGTHTVWVDDKDVVWLSEVWNHKLTKFDPRTEQFTQFQLDIPSPINFPGFGNFGLAPDGYVWHTVGPTVAKIDPNSGKYVARYPLDRIYFTYDNLISKDGNFWVGGQWPGNLIGMLDTRTGEVWEYETRSRMSSPAKGGFDWEGNAWFGGRGGQLIKFDTTTRRSQEYFQPTPHVTFYEAMPDKNGEIWAGEQHGGRFARFNPNTDHWVEYVLPEPFAHDRRTWIDDSTNPVTVWYVDHNGYMVRIQPLE